jgi:hypothetical protein
VQGSHRGDTSAVPAHREFGQSRADPRHSGSRGAGEASEEETLNDVAPFALATTVIAGVDLSSIASGRYVTAARSGRQVFERHAGLGVQDFAGLAARFAGVRTAGAGAEALSASTVVTKRIP